jgi:hypothetical protein
MSLHQISTKYPPQPNQHNKTNSKPTNIK